MQALVDVTHMGQPSMRSIPRDAIPTDRSLRGWTLCRLSPFDRSRGLPCNHPTAKVKKFSLASHQLPYRCRHFRSNEMMLRIESGDENVKEQKWNAALYVAAGWDPYALLDHAIVAAAKRSGGAKARTEKELPESLDVFGWCTWDAFYSTVSAKGISEGLETLKRGGFAPKMLIIDDGWQSTGLDDDTHPPSTNLEDTAESTVEASIPLVPQSEIETTDDEVKDAVGCLQYLASLCLGCVTSVGILMYQWLVDKAPPGSARIRAFTYLVNGPLRKPMLNFYAMSGDFSRRLTSIEANGKFSSPTAALDDHWKDRKENLTDVIRYFKTELGVAYVYVWHGLSAYWGGISHEDRHMAKYRPRLLKAKPTPGILEIEPSLGINPAVVAGMGVTEKPEDLYFDMHNHLKASGVTGVKVDAQAGVGLIGSVLGGGSALAQKWHAALEDSVAKHFPGNHVINCMCHSTENLYRMLNTVVARASDDFYPRDASSITPHVAHCAYNALFMAPLVQPDWDMFQTKHEAAELHAAARAVSGGAVYVSDKPGQHDFEILRRLVLPDGSTLRAKIPGRPTRDCLFRNVLKDGKTLMKIWTRNEISGVVGIFNLQGATWDRRLRQFKTHDFKPPTLQTSVRVADVECLEDMTEHQPLFAGKFAVYAVRRQQLYVGNRDVCLCIRLPAFGSEIVSFTPILRLGSTECAAIGFPHLLNGTGAVRNFSGRRVVLKHLLFESECGNGTSISGAQMLISEERAPRTVTVFETNVKGCGEFLMHTNESPIDVWVNFHRIPYSYTDGKLTMKIEEKMSLENSIQILFK